jgi:hypothetical protein
MGAITPADCRAFVNTIVNYFDNSQPQEDMFSADLAQQLTDERARMPVNKGDTFKKDLEEYKKGRREQASTQDKIARFFAVSGFLHPTPRLSALKWLYVSFLGNPEENRTLALDNIESQTLEFGAESFLKRFGYPEDPGRLFPFLFPFYPRSQQLKSYVFQRAYCAADPDLKKEIIGRITPFSTEVNSFASSTERLIIKILEKIQRVFPKESFARFGACIVAGVTLSWIGPQLQAFLSKFFAQIVFPQAQRLLHQYGSITIIHLYEKGCSYGMVAVAKIVNSHFYHYTCVNGWTSMIFLGIVGRCVPYASPVLSTIEFIRFPVWTWATYTPYYIYDLCFHPAVLAQREIAQSLEGLKVKDPAKAQTLLEEGMKAYQVWMYLMTEGPHRELFREVPAAS